MFSCRFDFSLFIFSTAYMYS